MEKKYFTLDDNVIAQVAKLLQLAIITGTDVVDHLRQVRLEECSGSSLKLTDEYIEYDKKVVDALMDETAKLVSGETSTIN